LVRVVVTAAARPSAVVTGGLVAVASVAAGVGRAQQRSGQGSRRCNGSAAAAATTTTATLHDTLALPGDMEEDGGFGRQPT